MMKMIAPLIALVAMASLGFGQHDWGYEESLGRVGPNRWSERYPSCAGKRQAPVDVVDGSIKTDTTLKALRFINYDQPLTGLVMTNDGHSIRVNIPAKYDLRISTPSLPTSYKLTQFHFHWPSEHTFNGEQFPLELHFVHANTQLAEKDLTTNPAGLAVVAVLFDSRKGSYIGNSLRQILSNTVLTADEGENVTLTTPMTLDDLLPYDRSYIRYGGSLTTPGCAETVEFHILTNTMPIAKSYVARFANLRHEINVATRRQAEATIDHNNRPTQKLNGRVLRLYGNLGDLPNDEF